MFGDDKQDCFAKGVVYDMTCTACDEEAKERNDSNAPPCMWRFPKTPPEDNFFGPILKKC